MEPFVGRYDRSLDTKGRVILPARLRHYFDNPGYLAPHEDGCIALWTELDFNKEADRQLAREFDGREARDQVRDWFSQVNKMQLDAQGRMPIAPELRDYAALDQDVLFVGVHNRVEIWSKTNWDARPSRSSRSNGS